MLDLAQTLILRNYLYDTLGWPRVRLPPPGFEDEVVPFEETDPTAAQTRQPGEDDVPAFRADGPRDEDDQTPEVGNTSDLEQYTEYAPYGAEEVDPQDLRNVQYCVFDGEAEDDYTQGPARIVLASDGVQECAAILMRMDLSQYIQEAVQAQRSYHQKEQEVSNQLASIKRFQRKVRREIQNQRTRIATEEQVLPRREPKVVDHALIASFEQKIVVLEAMLEEMDRKRVLAEASLRDAERNSKRVLDIILGYLEEAFVEARLVPDPDLRDVTPGKDFDLETEYRAMARNLNGGEDETDAGQAVENEAPADSEPIGDDLGFGDAFLRPRLPTPTPEEQAAAALREAVVQANHARREAQAEFDRKEMYQERDRWENWQSYGSVEDFDIHWVQRNRELTHQLVEAEELYAQAKATALEAGVPQEAVSSETGSELDYDGYPLSHEVEESHIEAVRPGVNTWMEKVANVVDPDTQSDADVDDWQAEELDISDSISCVDRFVYRSQIDRWRQQVLSDTGRK